MRCTTLTTIAAYNRPYRTVRQRILPRRPHAKSCRADLRVAGAPCTAASRRCVVGVRGVSARRCRPPTRSTAMSARTKISTRIYGGFAAALLLLTTVAAATVPALRFAHQHRLTCSTVVENAVRVAPITASVSEARRNTAIVATRGDDAARQVERSTGSAPCSPVSFVKRKPSRARSTAFWTACAATRPMACRPSVRTKRSLLDRSVRFHLTSASENHTVRYGK